MIGALLTSLIDLLVLPFIRDVPYELLAAASGTASLTFHCCQWLAVTVLRYLYIVHPDLMDRKFPNPKTLTAVTVCSVFTLFIEHNLMVD